MYSSTIKILHDRHTNFLQTGVFLVSFSFEVNPYLKKILKRKKITKKTCRGTTDGFLPHQNMSEGPLKVLKSGTSRGS